MANIMESSTNPKESSSLEEYLDERHVVEGIVEHIGQVTLGRANVKGDWFRDEVIEF